MDFEKMTTDVEEQFKVCVQKEQELIGEMMKMGEVLAIDVGETTDEEKQELMRIGQDIDGRTAFLLRQMLLRFGNLLFL